MVTTRFRIVSAIAFTLFAVHGAMARETLSLDSTWQIVFDDENRGREAGWHLDRALAEHRAKRKIHVPRGIYH